MRDQLLHYYENELRFVRRQLVEFAESYPAVASQLLLEPDKCEDPHVERLIESFAMLTARVQMRLDDDFPEISTALLNIVHPHLLTPSPSATIVQFNGDSDRDHATSGALIPRHSQIYTPPVKGVRCRFRTSYNVTLWPIQVSDVSIISLDRGNALCPPEAVAAIRIGLSTVGGQSFFQLPLDKLQFFFDGNPATAHRLYELFFRNSCGVIVRPGQKDTEASRVGNRANFNSPSVLRQMGFAADEDLFDTSGTAHIGHQLLQEYFIFPDKFLFGEIGSLSGEGMAAAGQELEILVLLDRLPLDLEGKIGPDNLKLGCTPAVNLFPHQAEPITLKHTAPEYRIIPDASAQDSFEVHSVLHVESVDARTGDVRDFRPIFAMRHGDPKEDEMAFWHMTRRQGRNAQDGGTECYLTMVDSQGSPSDRYQNDTMMVHIMATNRDLPVDLPLGTRGGAFGIEGQPGIESITTLRKPTASLHPPQGKSIMWRLISLLSLNYLSLLEVVDDKRSHDGGGPVAFREMMALLDFSGTAVTQQRIAGLTGLDWRRVVRQVSTSEGRLLTRGLEVTLHFEESNYTGNGVFMFASILEDRKSVV